MLFFFFRENLRNPGTKIKKYFILNLHKIHIWNIFHLIWGIFANKIEYHAHILFYSERMVLHGDETRRRLKSGTLKVKVAVQKQYKYVR